MKEAGVPAYWPRESSLPESSKWIASDIQSYCVPTIVESSVKINP